MHHEHSSSNGNHDDDEKKNDGTDASIEKLDNKDVKVV